MTIRFLVLCLAFACGAVLPCEAAAQYHFPVSTEASFGFRVGHGGTYATRSRAAIDVVLGFSCQVPLCALRIKDPAIVAQWPELRCRPAIKLI